MRYFIKQYCIPTLFCLLGAVLGGMCGPHGCSCTCLPTQTITKQD